MRVLGKEIEAQKANIRTQINYYTTHIQSRSDWEFAGIYTDEGISVTSTKHRQGFQNMITDALNGKIDLILTKSVSRFARNTVDSLTTFCQLKDAGVEVYFEKENIWSLDSKGELLITIMSASPKKNPAPSARTSPGDTANAFKTEKSWCHTPHCSDTGKARTAT